MPEHTDDSVTTPERLQLSSSALGDIEVAATWVMHFPLPLGGFPTHSEFVLIPAAREGLWWLQALADPDLTFLLADPFVVDPSYGFDLGDVEREMLGIENPADAFGLVMITLPASSGDAVTANFRAPIVFHLTKQLGLQVVSRDDGHLVRRPTDLSVYKPQAIGLRMR